jgi:hypothetical protein
MFNPNLMELWKCFDAFEEHEEGVLSGHDHVLVEAFGQSRQKTLQDGCAPANILKCNF